MRPARRRHPFIRLPALLGWGIVIYAVVYLAWSALVIHDYTEGLAPRLILTVVLVAVALIAGRSLRFRSWVDILPYSLGWAAMAFLFDMLCAVPVSGWGMYADWSIWVGYGLVIAVPLLAPVTLGAPEAAARVS